MTVTASGGHQFVRDAGNDGGDDTVVGPGGGAGTYGSLEVGTSF